MDSDESSTVWLRCEHCWTLESAAAEKHWARGVLGGDTAPVPVLANAGVQEAGEDFGAVAEKHWVCVGPGVCWEATAPVPVHMSGTERSSARALGPAGKLHLKAGD